VGEAPGDGLAEGEGAGLGDGEGVGDGSVFLARAAALGLTFAAFGLGDFVGLALARLSCAPRLKKHRMSHILKV
jgi:hypothetical protein